MPDLERAGQLHDAHGAPLAAWSVVLTPLDATGGAPLTPVALRGAQTDASGAFNVPVPADATAFSVTASALAAPTRAFACTVTLRQDGTLDVSAPVLPQRGRALQRGALTPLRNHALVWRDTSRPTAWSGIVTDAQGAYSIHEEQGRPVTVYAFSEVSKTWYVLSSLTTNSDGTRDMIFALWSYPNHPFARRDNPLGGAADMAHR